MPKKYYQKVTPLHRRGAGGEGLNGRRTSTQILKNIVGVITLLLLTISAPACAPNEPPLPPEIPRNLVLLTDTTQWSTSSLTTYKDSLTNEGYRVIVSGYPGETPQELTARLPWLLQPGVDLFLYDENLAGASGFDSLVYYLEAQKHPGEVRSISR